MRLTGRVLTRCRASMAETAPQHPGLVAAGRARFPGSPRGPAHASLLEAEACGRRRFHAGGGAIPGTEPAGSARAASPSSPSIFFPRRLGVSAVNNQPLQQFPQNRKELRFDRRHRVASRPSMHGNGASQALTAIPVARPVVPASSCSRPRERFEVAAKLIGLPKPTDAILSATMRCEWGKTSG